MSEKMSPQERQRRLNEASEKYMHGKLDAEEFERAERSYGVNYREAAQTLARKRVRPERGWRKFIRRAASA